MYCSNCGKEVSQNINYCDYCGAKVANNTFNQEFINNDMQNDNTIPDNNFSQNTDFQESNNHTYYQNVQQPIYQPEIYVNNKVWYYVSEKDKTLRIVAFVFNLICTIIFGILLIPLCWMVPMTVRSWRTYKGKKPNTVALGVCTLIFVNLISGILLLVSKKDL